MRGQLIIFVLGGKFWISGPVLLILTISTATIIAVQTYYHWRHYYKRSSPLLYCYAGLIFYVLWESAETINTTISHRMMTIFSGILSLHTAYSIVIFCWVQIIFKINLAKKRKQRRLLIGFIIANVVMWALNLSLFYFVCGVYAVGNSYLLLFVGFLSSFFTLRSKLVSEQRPLINKAFDF
eukprot:TRINITY_DN4352_c0_g1_i1.p1 TRINITY_DN4352_c0_g1~~TRINITY_DN4352_c0_g1_i1.p1  ORF type:complete len:208 (+),score=5.44 TRINITY_DN4352_c0_g1_i1:84-626(+)